MLFQEGILVYGSHLPDVAVKHMAILVSTEPEKTLFPHSVTDFSASPKDHKPAPSTGKAPIL